MNEHAHVPVWTHFPCAKDPIVPVFDFGEFNSKAGVSSTGHFLWYDVTFMNDGAVVWRTSPCGDAEEPDGYY